VYFFNALPLYNFLLIDVNCFAFQQPNDLLIFTVRLGGITQAAVSLLMDTSDYNCLL